MGSAAGTKPTASYINGRALGTNSYRLRSSIANRSTLEQFEADVGKPHMLFEEPYPPAPLTYPNYNVSPDGQRFLMVSTNRASGCGADANRSGDELV